MTQKKNDTKCRKREIKQEIKNNILPKLFNLKKLKGKYVNKMFA